MGYTVETYFEVSATDAIDRSTKEGELAWEELTTHHAIPYVKEGRYLIEPYWQGYHVDPYDNLEIAKEDYGKDWTNEGMLAKVVADYIRKTQPCFEQWQRVLLHVTW